MIQASIYILKGISFKFCVDLPTPSGFKSRDFCRSPSAAEKILPVPILLAGGRSVCREDKCGDCEFVATDRATFASLLESGVCRYELRFGTQWQLEPFAGHLLSSALATLLRSLDAVPKVQEPFSQPKAVRQRVQLLAPAVAVARLGEVLTDSERLRVLEILAASDRTVAHTKLAHEQCAVRRATCPPDAQREYSDCELERSRAAAEPRQKVRSAGQGKS